MTPVMHCKPRLETAPRPGVVFAGGALRGWYVSHLAVPV